ncbi:hypothetical protein CTAYLR_000498 [Chrysophaeum taylorii]|uniref:Dienelactone hydrolase domain-containing protein n=1 Tax=Chrysophaeum taylorii TaxID=2483200 RepID=A0AAD7XN19_9STRA|nr:hypothetical protein CTAYLR_000498 [Chrysophaeum taylorii]
MLVHLILLVAVAAHGPEGYRRKDRGISRDGHIGEDIEAFALNYTIGDEVFEGYLAYPTTLSGEIPGLMIVHQWYGLGENEQDRAIQAAENGYAAFAIDMYGYGIRATSNAEAAALSGAITGNETLLLERAAGGLAQLMPGGVASQEISINQSALVANGYCFGGNVVLTYARVYDDFEACAVFHATFPDVTGFASTDTAVQIHHGQLDFQGDQALYDVQDQLANASVAVWETAYYSGAAHGFSDFLSDAYLKRAADQSHVSMFSFYDGVLGSSSCEDSTSWYKEGEPSKDCLWVSEWTPRCQAKGSGILADSACPASCGTC